MTMITELIHRAADGDRAAFDSALQAIQLELRSLAARRLQADSRATLSPTMLVNETWLKLADSVVRADDRTHFFRIAAAAMKQIWIDRKRSRAADVERIRLYVDAIPEIGGEPVAAEDWSELVDWDAAMRTLDRDDPELAELVSLRVFTGLDLDEVAALQGVSLRTVQRQWRTARAFLLNV